MASGGVQRSGAAARFGVHTPPQHVDVATLRVLWRRIEALGFDWISVWDHFVPVLGTGPNHEAVALHAALACTTERVRCGCLVYCTAYRSAGVLAKAATTIDHLSGGRCTIGLGAGYLASEFAAFGVPFGSPAERSRHLADTVAAVRALLDGGTVTIDGPGVQLDGARLDPRPVQDRLPIWVGGGGERRTLPLAGRVADGWNVPMATPADFARKAAVVTRAAVDAGRHPADVERTVSVGLCWDLAALPERFGPRWEQLRPSVLGGSTQQVVDHVAQYVEGGADWLLLSLRPPYDGDELERFATEVAPAFAPPAP